MNKHFFGYLAGILTGLVVLVAPIIIIGSAVKNTGLSVSDLYANMKDTNI